MLIVLGIIDYSVRLSGVGLSGVRLLYRYGIHNRCDHRHPVNNKYCDGHGCDDRYKHRLQYVVADLNCDDQPICLTDALIFANREPLQMRISLHE